MKRFDLLYAIVAAALFMTLITLGTVWDQAKQTFSPPDGCILYEQGVCM